MNSSLLPTASYGGDWLKRLSDILGLLMGIIFLVAGIGKLLSLKAFAATVGNITHMSAHSSAYLAILILSCEIVGSVALLARFRLRLVSVLFCDLINEYPTLTSGGRICAVFRKDNIADPANPARIASWAKSTNIRFPVLIAPESLFSQINFEKSTAVVTNTSRDVLFLQKFPMGNSEHSRALQLLISN